MIHYFVSYQGFVDDGSPAIGNITVKRVAPITGSKDIESVEVDLIRMLREVRKDVNFKGVRVMYWRRYEDPE